MLDVSKRRTIQLMGAVPLLSLPLVSMASAAGDKALRSAALLPAAKPRTGLPVQIQIIHSSSVPDNDVLIRNNGDDDLTISRFMPGHIYFDGQIMDLNESTAGKALRLKSGDSVALSFRVWPVVNAGPTEYVWADQSVERLSDETSIITLGAFMADTNAVVYADTSTDSSSSLIS